MKKRKVLLLILALAGTGIIFGYLLYQGRLPFRTLACEGQVDRLRFSPDGHVLAVIVHGKNISLWDTRTWKRLQIFPGVFSTCYFLSDSRSLITDRSYSIAKGPIADAINRGEGLTMAEWGRQRKNMRYCLQCWDVSSSHATKTFMTPPSNVQSYAPAVQRVILQCFTPKPGISIVDTEDGHEIHFLPTAPSATADISPDGRWLSIIDFAQPHGMVTLWNTQTWQKKTLSTSPGVQDAQFSPDGKWLAATAPKSVTLWRTTDWQNGVTLPNKYDNVVRLSFSQNSQQVIADGSSWNAATRNLFNSSLTIWDVTTGRKITTLTNQMPVSWRVTNRGIVTLDTTSYHSILWNTKNGHQLWQSFIGYEPSVDISPDGQTLVTAHNTNPSDKGGIVLEIRHLPPP